MTQQIHIDPSDVPSIIRRAVGYTGRQWKIHVAPTVHIGNQQWTGGSRDQYYAVRLDTGQSGPVEDPRHWPQNMSDIGQFDLQPNLAVLRHSLFCGKDVGVTIYVHPDNASALLPQPAGSSLTPTEKVVLAASRALKSSYNGQDRYQMAATRYGVPNARQEVNDGAESITRLEWEDAKANLIARGFLNKRGAITTKGKNAAEPLFNF